VLIGICLDCLRALEAHLVCSHIILLSTPTLANVTKIAHRERVPNGTLPKLGRVLTPLCRKATPSSKKKRLWWRCASSLHQLICHHKNLLLPWSVFVWQTLCRKKFIGQATFIFKIIYLELLENCHRSYYVNQELSSFIWMQSLCVASFIEYLLLKFIIVLMIEITCTVEVAPCAWPHVIIAVDYVLQLCDTFGHSTLEWCYTVCMDTNCLVTSTLYVNGTVTPQSLHVHQWWNNGGHQQHLTIMEQDYWTRLLDKFVDIHLQPASMLYSNQIKSFHSLIEYKYVLHMTVHKLDKQGY